MVVFTLLVAAECALLDGVEVLRQRFLPEDGWPRLPSAYWFVVVLFFADAVLSVLLVALRGVRLRVAGAALLSLLVGLLFSSCQIQYPYSLNVVPLAVFYMAVGNIVGESVYALTRKSDMWALSVLALLLVALNAVAVSSSKHLFVMSCNHVICSDLPAQAAGVGVTLIVSVLVMKVGLLGKVLAMVGANTMVLYLAHYELLHLFWRLWGGKGEWSSLVWYGVSLLTWTFVLSLVLTYVVLRWAPWMAGKPSSRVAGHAGNDSK